MGASPIAEAANDTPAAPSIVKLTPFKKEFPSTVSVLEPYTVKLNVLMLSTARMLESSILLAKEPPPPGSYGMSLIELMYRDIELITPPRISV